MHTADPDFWYHYRTLPQHIRDLADKNFELLKQSADHPSLRFKKVKDRDGLWSARVGLHYRALAIEVEGGGWHWFWIGSHADYDRVIGL